MSVVAFMLCAGGDTEIFFFHKQSQRQGISRYVPTEGIFIPIHTYLV